MRWASCLLVLLLAAGAMAEEVQSAPVEFYNQPITVFRGEFAGFNPVQRAAGAPARISAALERGGPGLITVKTIDQGRVVQIDGQGVFGLVPDDLGPGDDPDLDHAAGVAVENLRLAIEASRRPLTTLPESIARAAGWSLGAILTLLLIRRWSLRFVRRMVVPAWLRLERRLPAHSRGLIGAVGIRIVVLLASLAGWACSMAVLYIWLGAVLRLFAYTRPWGEHLLGAVLHVAETIAKGVTSSLPNLLLVVAILLLTRSLDRWLRLVIDRLAVRGTDWLDRDTAVPTRRIVSVVLWAFALVMVYPYLPGSGSEAFKGMSVMIGLMFSLGASSLVGQAIGGLGLMYARTVRVGDWVRLGDKEGQVVAMSLFSIRLQTPLGRLITMPNSAIQGAAVENLTRSMSDGHLILTTTVTIGYDTPWRQVEALLIAAARATPGVLTQPAPWVLQAALEDWYPRYVLHVAVPSPAGRGVLLSHLHAAIQDEFNRHGVQIMSPNYEADPPQAKIVPPEQWHAAPAAAAPHLRASSDPS
jgi:small-conductance mechanosensitive channel